jgi:hypothetical protein
VALTSADVVAAVVVEPHAVALQSSEFATVNVDGGLEANELPVLHQLTRLSPTAQRKKAEKQQEGFAAA